MSLRHSSHACLRSTQEQHETSRHAAGVLINKQSEAVVAKFNPDAATDAEKRHCNVNAAAVETKTPGVLPENIVGRLKHDAAHLKTLRNVLDDVPKVSKGMRDKLKRATRTHVDNV